MTDTDIVRFTVFGQPVAKARARVATRDRRGRALAKATSYTPKNSAEYSAWVRAHAVNAMIGRERITTALRMNLIVSLQVPKSWTKNKQALARSGVLMPTSKPDLSNFVKQIEDACNGVVYLDDGQIIASSESKSYAVAPDFVGVAVEFIALPNHQSA